MPDDPNQNPPKPDPGQPEQGIRQNAQPGSNIERSVGGEMPTADHERAALKIAASSGDGKGVQADPLSPSFNAATQPPEPPEPTKITPAFNAAAAKPPQKLPEAKLEHNPPTPSGPGGSAPVSPQLREKQQVDAQAFKEKLLKRKFNEKARDSMDRDR